MLCRAGGTEISKRVPIKKPAGRETSLFTTDQRIVSGRRGRSGGVNEGVVDLGPVGRVFEVKQPGQRIFSFRGKGAQRYWSLNPGLDTKKH